ncbi:MAG: haloacid dehalogenase-like hydrolase [Bdellovibrionaceae bacterium]|nr:haloacid dehalogenase-like hydrolase [Pseudobdellovibrionaceae bacterium]
MVTTVLSKVDSYLKNHPAPYYAAFDADGTLWSSDVGENFFQYQIDHCELDDLKNKDPWAHYLELKKKHPPTAYLWLAQICRDYTIKDVQGWAIDAATKNKPDMFPEQKQLITELQQRNIQVCVVSASVEWAVEGALTALGIKNVRSLGVKTKIKSGRISTEQDGFVTWREGKKDAFMELTNGIAPLLSCGNTLGDQHLLEMSADVRIAIQSLKNGKHHPMLFEDEQGLLALAQKNQWLTFDFSKP